MKIVGAANLILKISEFGIKQERFTLTQVREALKLDTVQWDYLQSTLTSFTRNADNPNQILCFVNQPQTNLKGDVSENEYSLTPTALFNYVDWLEIVEARKMADNANNQSLLAVRLTIYTVLISLVIGIASIGFQFAQIYFDHFLK